MKKNLVLSVVFFLLAVAPISVSAQARSEKAAPATAKPTAAQTARTNSQPVPDTKIALVDTTAFSDEKSGITRYLNAVKTLEPEFRSRTHELEQLQNQIKAIEGEIAKLSGNSVVGSETIQAKQQESQRLQRELKYKKEQADADYEKRFNEVLRPLSADIGKALDEYASQHGLTMILDISKLAPAVLSVNPAMDITRAFIAEYNRKNP
jgi:Skp family chaperone for outer membrane proteins